MSQPTAGEARLGVGARDGWTVAHGVRTPYREQGEGAEALVLVHGLGANHRLFDGLVRALALSGRRRVIAYSMRGHGRADATGPYLTATLAGDLEALMDAWKLERAHLAGWSLGGNVITELAARSPGRVGKLIYLDSVDTGAPGFLGSLDEVPEILRVTPPEALGSADAYRRFLLAADFSRVSDLGPVEAFIEEAIEPAPEGGVRLRMSPATEAELIASLAANLPRPYREVRAPALALFAGEAVNPDADYGDHRAEVRTWIERSWRPLRAAAIARMRRELGDLRIRTIAGAHNDFFLISQAEVAGAIDAFLAE